MGTFIVIWCILALFAWAFVYVATKGDHEDEQG